MIDLETTGLEQTARAVEIAVVVVDRLGEGEPVQAWRSLIDPEMEIPWQASKIHGIYDKHVKDAPTIGTVWTEMRRHLDGGLWCAHNVAYDRRVLAYEAGLLDLSAPPQAPAWIDTLAIARRLGYVGKAGGTLKALCQRYGVAEGKHTAGSDATATAKILPLLLGDVWKRPELGLPESCTVREFLRWQSGAPAPRPRGQASLLDLPPGSLTADQADELVRRDDATRTSTEQSRSLRLRRSTLAPVQLDLPVAVLAALPSIEDGDRPVPCEVRLRRSRSHTLVTWELLEGALWRALVERLRLHLEGGGGISELWLPGWSWEEVREAAAEARQRRAA